MSEILELHKNLEGIFNTFQNVHLNENLKLNDCIWNNKLFFSPSIRYGHLEYFKGSNEKIEVLHNVIYPSYFKAIPIFGFDVISLGGKITGVFCDFTPAPYDFSELRTLQERIKKELNECARELPDWAKFFSTDFIAVTPNNNFNDIKDKCLLMLYEYLRFCEFNDFNNNYLSSKDVENHITGQNEYSVNQRKNTKTQKALAKYIGEDKANEFIEKVLFPSYRFLAT